MLSLLFCFYESLSFSFLTVLSLVDDAHPIYLFVVNLLETVDLIVKFLEII